MVRITILGQSITVGVRHGTKFLQEMGFEKLLADCIARHTGVTPKVSLISAVSEAEQHQMEEKLERKIAPPVVKFEKRISSHRVEVGPDRQAGEHLPRQNVTLKPSPSRIWAARAASAPSGDVFFTEVKGNYRKIYTVSITDYTGSINLKIRAQEGEDCSKWESIGKGTTVIVRGDCSYDKYEHDYIVYLPDGAVRGAQKAGGHRPGQASGAAPGHQTVQHGLFLATPAASCGWPTAWGTAALPLLTTVSGLPGSYAGGR